MDDDRQGSDESLTSYYSCFQQEYIWHWPSYLKQKAFMKSLGPKGVITKDNHQVIDVYNPKKLSKMVKSYID